MARAKKTKESNAFFDDPNRPPPTKMMWCNEKERLEPIIACLYKCGDKATCLTYYQLYEDILEMPIPEKYLDKYGVPDYVVPKALIKRQKLEAKAAKAAEKEEKAKKKTKRKVKSPAKGPDTITKKQAKDAVKKVSATKKTTKPAKSTDLTDW